MVLQFNGSYNIIGIKFETDDIIYIFIISINIRKLKRARFATWFGDQSVQEVNDDY